MSGRSAWRKPARGLHIYLQALHSCCDLVSTKVTSRHGGKVRRAWMRASRVKRLAAQCGREGMTAQKGTSAMQNEQCRATRHDRPRHGLQRCKATTHAVAFSCTVLATTPARPQRTSSATFSRSGPFHETHTGRSGTGWSPFNFFSKQ